MSESSCEPEELQITSEDIEEDNAEKLQIVKASSIYNRTVSVLRIVPSPNNNGVDDDEAEESIWKNSEIFDMPMFDVAGELDTHDTRSLDFCNTGLVLINDKSDNSEINTQFLLLEENENFNEQPNKSDFSRPLDRKDSLDENEIMDKDTKELGNEETSATSENTEATDVESKELHTWYIVKWGYVISVSAMLLFSFCLLMYFFLKEKKVIEPYDNSKEHFMKVNNISAIDYEILVNNNKTLMRKKFPANPYLWF